VPLQDYLGEFLGGLARGPYDGEAESVFHAYVGTVSDNSNALLYFF